MRDWRVLVALSLLWTMAAAADPNDLNLSRLGNPVPGSPNYAPDANARFRAFALELAGSLNAASLVPPGSLGYSGFAVAVELGVAAIQGSKVFMPTRSAFSSPLLVPAVHVRKGLPYSIELGGKIAWLEKSRMMAATLEARWAFLEGFKFLPDVSIRGHVTRLFNAQDLNLTTGGIDLTIGKRFPVAGSVNFIPYGGWNVAWVSATTSTVDFDPGRDQTQSLTSPTAQFSDTGVFNPLLPGRNATHRLYVGVRFGAGMFRLGAEASLTIFGSQSVPDAADPSITRQQTIPILPAFSTTIGLSY